MDPTLLSVLNGSWLACLFVALGLVPGTLLTRALRLPPAFWMPLVFVCASTIAFAEFWIFFFNPVQAPALSAFVMLGSLAGALIPRFVPDLRALLRDRDAWLPCVLMALLTIAYLAYLAWGGGVASQRFGVPLPIEDNVIPWMLADRLFYGLDAGRVPPPPLTHVTLIVAASDRPPLQSAVLLAVRALGLASPRGRIDQTSYQIVSTVCQMVWVPVFYALGRTLGLRGRQIAFALGGAACSGFFLLNAVYTWPKLYAAWLFLLALALLIHVVRTAPPRAWPVWSLIGLSGALALLAHGSPFFSAIALPVLLLRRRLLPAFRPARLAAAVLAAFLAMAPWLAYQRFYDPPGNRLVKLHLAGVFDIDSRSTLQTLADRYSEMTWTRFVDARWENLREQGFVLGKFDPGTVAEWVQWQQFFHQLPALGALTAGLALFLVSRRRRTADRGPLNLTQLTWYAIAATLIWTVVMFNPNAATIHHGSYATTALLFFCSAAWVATLPAWAGATIMGLQLLILLAFWMPGWVPPNAPSPNMLMGAVAVAAFAGFAALLRLVPEPSTDSHA